MVHFGPSRWSMEVDLARPGLIVVYLGTYRLSMEVDLACSELLLAHFGISRRSEKHNSVAQGFIFDTLAPQYALRNQHRYHMG